MWQLTTVYVLPLKAARRHAISANSKCFGARVTNDPISTIAFAFTIPYLASISSFTSFRLAKFGGTLSADLRVRRMARNIQSAELTKGG